VETCMLAVMGGPFDKESQIRVPWTVTATHAIYSRRTWSADLVNGSRRSLDIVAL
jgi:hypothetical protein